MNQVTTIGFYGESNSGKTHLITKIIKILSEEGYKIAAIKMTDKKISIDTKGKDTWKYSQNGAKIVVFSTPIETNYLVKDSLNLYEAIQKINNFGKFDIILIEGANDPYIPKIRLGKIKERPNTIFSYNENFKELISIIRKHMDQKKDQNIQIKINGKKIPLTEFPEEIITNTIIGMLSSLKGVNEINNIEINIKK